MWFIEDEKSLPYFKQLQDKVKIDINRIPEKNPFEIFSLIKPEDIRVVMIGQDPYSTGVVENNIYKSYYDGIAFSSKNTTRAPASLQILKKLFINTELKQGNTVGNVPNDLRYLVEQGVFLGNLAYTTSRNNPGAHLYEEWITFNIRLVSYLSYNYPYVIFILFGAKATVLKPYINTWCPTFLEQHPAADKYKKTVSKLEDSNVLVYTNEIIKVPIKWTKN